MTAWVKIADAWLGSEEIEELGAEAIAYHLSALSWSSQQRTDGSVPRRALRHLFPVDDPQAVIAVLVEAGQWEPTGDGGYLLVRWTDHLLSKESQERHVEANRIRQERHRRHLNGDHSMCDRCSVVRANQPSTGGNALRNGVSNGVSNGPSTRLDSTRPEGERRGEERVGGSASGGGSASLTAPSAPPPTGPEPTPWVPGTLPPGVIPRVDGKPVPAPSSKGS